MQEWIGQDICFSGEADLLAVVETLSCKLQFICEKLLSGALWSIPVSVQCSVKVQIRYRWCFSTLVPGFEIYRNTG